MILFDRWGDQGLKMLSNFSLVTKQGNNRFEIGSHVCLTLKQIPYMSSIILDSFLSISLPPHSS